MTVRILTEPPYEPVTRAQAKVWLRVDSDITDQDAVIDLLIKSMRRYAENLTGRDFVQRTRQLVIARFPVLTIEGYQRSGIELPYPPLVSVESVTYIDTDGVQQTLASTEYNVHTWREPGFLVEDWDVTWPNYRTEPDAIRVNYTSGYSIGSPPDEAAYQENLPPELKVWIHARLATLYEHREQLVMGNMVKIPHHFSDGLLDNLIIGSRLF